MTAQAHFENLIKSGRPVGEVIGVDKFAVKLKGLNPVSLHSLVLFSDGSKGFVREIEEEYINVLHLGNKELAAGTLAVLQHDKLVCRVGKSYVGRVISVSGQPIDGKGSIAAEAVWPVFNEAPPIHARQLLESQLESGVVAIDSMFPVVRGQRIAVLGDSKSGKSSLASLISLNQKNTDQIVIYCLIAKRSSDVSSLIKKLEENGAMEKAIVVVSTVFESIINTYLAPYVACSLGEYLWQKAGIDTVVIYDDLTAHAQAYREISLLSSVSPGRDSYPGDMFYAHSSLLERAGRLQENGASQTAIPLVLASGGDISAYLPTNIMSITDGQWILDMNIFRNGIRPAISPSLSVTRVGGVGHTKHQKDIASQLLRTLAEYRQAEEFSRFGSELSDESKFTIAKGKNLIAILTQAPNEIYNTTAQQLMLDTVLNAKVNETVDIAGLKDQAVKLAGNIKDENDYQPAIETIKKLCVSAK